MDNSDLKENVLLNLRSVTQSCKGGVPFDRLQRDYRDLLGSPIPFRDLGYNSLEAFLRDIPHVISLRRNSDGQLVAMGVADSSTAHIVSLVSRQKTDTRKRTFRRPSYSSSRRSVSSRYTFREGARGSHSHYSSPPQRPKSPKPKLSKPPASVQHSKPHAPVEVYQQQVPSRKYETPPRFLKQKELENGSSQELVSSNVPSLSSPSLSSSSLSSPRLPPRISPPTLPPSSLSSSLHNTKVIPAPSYKTEVIPPPRVMGRSLPIKPQRQENIRTIELESAKTAKEFVDIYANMNNITPTYRTILFGQRKKGFVSTLKLGDKSYQSYPEMKPTGALAEEVAATKAMEDIKKRKEVLNILPETPYSNTEEIRILLNRIEEIVCEKPSGMFDNGIVREYEDQFRERLPSCWPELLKQSNFLEVEELKVEYGKVPDGVNFIVHQTKELSSGNRTPSSTSSKPEFVYENLDTGTLKKSLANISLPKITELKIPSGNVWDVYITDVGDTAVNDSISARLLDYYDDFLALSEEMSQFYKPRTFPVVEVYEYQVYAACTDDTANIWHRVVVDEINKDGQIACYFVDEGDISCVKKENLQEMSPSFLKLPYQAIHLTLDGLEEYKDCIRSDIFEKQLLGKTLIAEVKRCYPIPDFFPEISGMNRTTYSVVLYDTSDPSENDINLNEVLKKSAVESLVCKLPKLSTATCAYLSHVTPEGLVYLRLTNPQQCWIEQELERLSAVFEESSAAASKIPLNTMCAAKYESGTWHRAIVSESLHASHDPEMVEVFFVDYGHVGVVGKSEICEVEPISELLASAPHQAISCELSNALPSPTSHWTNLATAKLLELAPFDQELIFRVVSEEDGNNLAKVNLYKRNRDSNIISINESLSCNPTLFYEEPVKAVPIKAPTMLPLRQNSRKNSLKNNLSAIIPDVAIPAEEQMAAKRLETSLSSEKIEWLTTPDNIKSPEAFEVQTPVSLNQPPVPDIGKLFDVFVTMASHPHNFVIQPLSSSGDLDKLMKDMKQFYASEENLLDMDFSMLRKNDCYAALHSDGDWYRVRIAHIINGSPVMVAVHYVDFGDFNTVSIGRLQPLYNKFKQLPCQAIKASLAGIRPFDSDWDPVQCVKFQDMVKEKPFVSVICKKLMDVTDSIPGMQVELTLIDTTDSAKDIYIHELLIEKNIAKSQ